MAKLLILIENMPKASRTAKCMDKIINIDHNTESDTNNLFDYNLRINTSCDLLRESYLMNAEAE